MMISSHLAELSWAELSCIHYCYLFLSLMTSLISSRTQSKKKKTASGTKMIQSRVLIKKKHLLHQPTRVPLKASPAQEADVGWRRCMTNWCCLLERPAWPRPNATTRRDRQTERETENRWGHQVRAVTYPNLWILDSHWPVHPFWPEHQSSLWLQMSHLEIKEKQEQKGYYVKRYSQRWRKCSDPFTWEKAAVFHSYIGCFWMFFLLVLKLELILSLL